MNTLKKTRIIIITIIALILVVLIVGFLSSLSRMMRKEFKDKFNEFQHIYLDITSIMDNEGNAQKCIIQMNTTETQEKIKKLEIILEYMDNNAKTEYEVDASNGLPRYVKYLEEFIFYDALLLENDAITENKRKISNDYLTLKMCRRTFMDNLENNKYLY